MFDEYFPDWLMEAATSDYCIGIVFFLLLIVIFRIIFRKCRIIISDSKLGKIRMSNHALRTVVYGVCKESEWILDPKIKLRVKRGKVVVDVSVKLGVYKNISTVTSDLQVKLGEVLISSFGLNVDRINVIVSGFSCCAQDSKFVPEESVEDPDQAD